MKIKLRAWGIAMAVCLPLLATAQETRVEASGHAGHGMGGMKGMEAPSAPASAASAAMPMHGSQHKHGSKP